MKDSSKYIHPSAEANVHLLKTGTLRKKTVAILEKLTKCIKKILKRRVNAESEVCMEEKNGR